MKLPANIDIELTFLLQETLNLYDARINSFVKDRLDKGWNIYVVNQSRGRCWFKAQVITIPTFAIKHGKGYCTWYISHELAHSYAGILAKHGPLFMRELIRICPAEYIHLETGYKPRLAIAAGISKKQFDNIELFNLTKEDLL